MTKATRCWKCVARKRGETRGFPKPHGFAGKLVRGGRYESQRLSLRLIIGGTKESSNAKSAPPRPSQLNFIIGLPVPADFEIRAANDPPEVSENTAFGFYYAIYYAILKKKEEREIGNDVFLCFKTAAEILRCESFRF